MAVDTETFYSSDYSVADLGLWGYVNDSRFDCYLVSFFADDIKWVGNPRQAPWHLIAGRVWVSHNKGFDKAVIARCQELGIVPRHIAPSAWHCTANLAVYSHLPRSLAAAVQAAFNHKIDKTIRDKDIKGKSWDQFGEELQKNVCAYALADGEWCLKLWTAFSPQWPEKERNLSELTYEQGEYGIYVDREGLEKDIQILERVKFEAQRRIPWAEDYSPLSPKALKAECLKVGIAPPTSLAQDSDECEAWEDEYGETYGWVAAMRDYRRSNAILKKYRVVEQRLQPNGRMGYSLMYGGAHTLRWSGGGGFNLQNMPRAPFYFDADWHFTTEDKAVHSVWLRDKLIAAPGKKFIIADYAQIEARVTPWLAGDLETLKLAAKGMSVYEAHARVSMGWTGGNLKKEAPLLYQLAKARVLGLGFGCGWFKFVTFAKKSLDAETFRQIFGAEYTTEQLHRFLEYLEKTDGEGTRRRMWKKLGDFDRRTWVNSWLQVSDFRRKNPKIVDMWKKLDRAFKGSVGENFEMQLPSGRWMRYWNVNDSDGSAQARTTRGGTFYYLYGGLLVENLVQATARDIFAEALLRVRAEGIKIVLHAHDEIVIEVDQDFDGKRLEELMTIPPAWAKTLPIGVEWEESLTYKK